MSILISETRYYFELNWENNNNPVKVHCERRFYNVIRSDDGETTQMLIKEYDVLGNLVDTKFTVFDNSHELYNMSSADIILSWIMTRTADTWLLTNYSFGFIHLELWPFIINKN